MGIAVRRAGQEKAGLSRRPSSTDRADRVFFTTLMLAAMTRASPQRAGSSRASMTRRVFSGRPAAPMHPSFIALC
ncbi:MAG TPA: hypothetical protein VLB69_11370 [Rudaea sp.]|nr:hypothetical protein [Rudaea sp.]